MLLWPFLPVPDLPQKERGGELTDCPDTFVLLASVSMVFTTAAVVSLSARLKQFLSIPQDGLFIVLVLQHTPSHCIAFINLSCEGLA